LIFTIVLKGLVYVITIRVNDGRGDRYPDRCNKSGDRQADEDGDKKVAKMAAFKLLVFGHKVKS
jgi:hypothetical protein